MRRDAVFRLGLSGLPRLIPLEWRGQACPRPLSDPVMKDNLTGPAIEPVQFPFRHVEVVRRAASNDGVDVLVGCPGSRAQYNFSCRKIERLHSRSGNPHPEFEEDTEARTTDPMLKDGMLHSIRQQSEPGQEARRSILTGRVSASQGTTGTGFCSRRPYRSGLPALKPDLPIGTSFSFSSGRGAMPRCSLDSLIGGSKPGLVSGSSACFLLSSVISKLPFHRRRREAANSLVRRSRQRN